MLCSARRRLPALVLPLLLLACGRSSPEVAEAETLASPWSSRLEAPVDDPYAAGRDYAWQGPTAAAGVGPQALGAGDNFLSDLTWTWATSSWGPIEKDRSNGEKAAGDGRTLTIGGQTFAKGLGLHARADVLYTLNTQCGTFSASIGIDDEVGNRGSVTFQVYGDGVKLYDSGVLTGADAARTVSVKIAGVRNLRLVTEGGDSISSDHADWAGARVSCAATPPFGAVNLSDLAYTSASNGWGPVELDRSNGEQGAGDGRTLTVAGETWPKGLGVHSRSTLTYYLGGNCSDFGANIGVDDEVGNRGSVTFEVYGDDRKLWGSPVMRGSDGSVYVTAGVTGVQVLKLVVTDGGDGPSADHADWANAGLLCTPPPAPGAVLRVFLDTLEDFVCTQGEACPLRLTVTRDGVIPGDATVTLTGLPAGVTGPQRITLPGTSESVSIDLSYTVAPSAPLGTPAELTFTAAAGGFIADARTLLSIHSVHGTFDPTFSPVGLRFNDVSTASRLLVQPDGKVIAAGSAYQENVTRADDLVLVRYNPDGSLDPTFGSGGAVVLNGGGVENTPDLRLQGDGKIVLSALQVPPSGPQRILVWRLLPDGRVDPTFGSQGRITLGSTQAGTFPGGLEILPDGRIVVGGVRGAGTWSLFVARLNPNGTLDPTFGTGGVALHAVSNLQQDAPTLALEPDGRIVMGYATTVSNGQTWIPTAGLARLRANGAPDTTWNGTGFLALKASGSTYVSALARQPDGRWLAAGMGPGTSDVFGDFLLARFDASGRLDSTFGAGGMVLTDFKPFPTPGWGDGSSSGDGARALLLWPDGRILVAGAGCQGERLASARYLPGGQLDVSWGVSGRSCLALAGLKTSASDVRLDPQGRPWAATPVFGRDGEGSATRVFVVTRLRP